MENILLFIALLCLGQEEVVAYSYKIWKYFVALK